MLKHAKKPPKAQKAETLPKIKMTQTKRNISRNGSRADKSTASRWRIPLFTRTAATRCPPKSARSVRWGSRMGKPPPTLRSGEGIQRSLRNVGVAWRKKN